MEEHGPSKEVVPQDIIDTEKMEESLVSEFRKFIRDILLIAGQKGMTPRKLETLLWKKSMPFFQMIMSHLLALVCLRKSLTDLKKRGLEIDGKNVFFRFDSDYWAERKTTFGKVVFPLFAFRIYIAEAYVTHAPARELFPYHRKCHSSELCLEWEVRLGADHPFRQAQEALNYFTHGAVAIEDNTIAEPSAALAATKLEQVAIEILSAKQPLVGRADCRL